MIGDKIMARYNNKFIYGSECMGRTAEYDADEDYENNESCTDEGSYCNNDCLSCMLECPYKGY